MLLRRIKLTLSLIALAGLLAGCILISREMDPYYLAIKEVQVIDEIGPTLRITGHYGESAWGIRNIKSERAGNTLLLSGTIYFHGDGAIDYTVKVPEEVQIVKFYNQIVWERK